MKTKHRILSMMLALCCVITTCTGTLAFADDTGAAKDSGITDSGVKDSGVKDSGVKDSGAPTSVISLNDFDSVDTVELYSRTYYDIEVDPSDVTLTVSSSDDSVLKTYLMEDPENPGYYSFVLEGWKEGTATVTFTASDGAEVSKDVTVENTGAEWNYAAQADLSEDFTIPSGNSRYITIQYENENLDYLSFPTLVADDPQDFDVALVGQDDDGNYVYCITANGSDGKTADLYLGSSDYVIPEKLCKVTAAENSNLSIDTSSTYVCNLYDTYDFVVKTNSATEPDVTAANGLVSITSLGKVDGGYKYEMSADEEGDSLVQATLNGETAAFAVKINYDSQPSVVSDTTDDISIEQNKTYTYKFSIMGGGTPSFAADAAGAFTVQSVKKDGIDYYCTVAATGDVGSSASLLVTFPDSGDDGAFTVNAGKITVKKPAGVEMTSDTNYDFSINKGSSYIFKISGATSFHAGTSGVFAVSKVGVSGKYTYYRITAVGQPGQSTGMYMSVPGQAAQKVCVVTVTPVSLTSDTNTDFDLLPTASYQFKITAPGLSSIHFNAGSSGVVKVTLVRHTGNDFYYKVTAVGTSGRQTGIYASVSGQAAKRLCVITVGSISVTSDTNYDFSLSKGASYQFKITAPGASSLSFAAGSSGTVSTALVKKSGNDFYFRITANGASGKQTGIYVTVPGQSAKKLCVVTVR